MSEPRGPGEAPDPDGWRSRFQFWVEILNKLALPFLTVAATVTGTWLTLTISERNNARATINQREQAESNLRSNMFSQLVNPLIDQSKSLPEATGTVDAATAARARADRLTLLAELLALNFHEHFELGPLLAYVERLDGQTEANRRTLRSVARRVTGRQIAMLGQPRVARCRGENDHSGHLDTLQLVSAPGEPATGQVCTLAPEQGSDPAIRNLQCVGVESLRAAYRQGQVLPPLTIDSPDCRDRLVMNLSELDWERQTLRVYVNNASAGTSEFVDFNLSTYSLPFSDNTLLRSGNRFGIYIRQVEPDPSTCAQPGCAGEERLMKLRFLWFPENFFPPRERPTDFAEVRRALKLEPDPGR